MSELTGPPKVGWARQSSAALASESLARDEARQALDRSTRTSHEQAGFSRCALANLALLYEGIKRSPAPS
jgi:hypothetical protein